MISSNIQEGIKPIEHMYEIKYSGNLTSPYCETGLEIKKKSICREMWNNFDKVMHKSRSTRKINKTRKRDSHLQVTIKMLHL